MSAHCRTCDRWKPAYEFLVIRDGHRVRIAECRGCIAKASRIFHHERKRKARLWRGDESPQETKP